MRDDSERCFALANELIEAARDERRGSGAIFYSDAMNALTPIAHALHQKGVPFPTVAMIMRDCATSFERSLLVDLEWYQNRKVTTEFGPPERREAASTALSEQRERMEQLLKERGNDIRLYEACKTLGEELMALHDGSIDRAESVVALARLVCDTYRWAMSRPSGPDWAEG
jgi:hypothetical protein